MPQWTGNYSRDMFPSSRRKQYVKSREQQGTEVSDADGNDNTDLLYEKVRNFLEKFGGNSYFFDEAFQVIANGTSNSFGIGSGSGFIKGHEAYLNPPLPNTVTGESIGTSTGGDDVMSVTAHSPVYSYTVYAAGTPLTESLDYTINPNTGSVTLVAGQTSNGDAITIDYEWYDYTQYDNDGSSVEDKNLHSVSTDLMSTVLTDTAMNWATNELTGRILVPNIEDGSTFTILSNTATTITVAGDMSAVAGAGDSYLVKISTPSGAHRTDAVWLNVYLDEIDATEDPYLNHNLGSGIELDRRIKVRTILMVEQGAETYSDYTDLDGNNHYLVKLATIQRFDGVGAINSVDVTDERNLTTSAGGSVVSLGDGTSGTLNDKISTLAPVAKQIVDPGGDEQLQLYLSNPNNPNLFLAGTNPPTWASPPSGDGGGGSLSSLAGKTFAPLLTGPKSILSITGSPASLDTDEFYHYRLDLDAAYLIPGSATHAVLRIAHDGAILEGATNYAILTSYADAFDPDLGGKTSAVAKAGNDPNGFISVGNEVAEYGFVADADNRAGDTHYTTVYVELNPARVQDPLDSQFYDASVVVATGGTSGGSGNVPVSPIGVRVFLDGYLLQEDTPQGASGAPLVGKTFVPTPTSERSIGQIYLHNGAPVTGDRSGTFDVINDGSGVPRFFPDNTTHLLLEGVVADANVDTGGFSGNLQIAPPGTVLPDDQYGTALVNAGGPGEGSLTSVAQIVLPYDPNDSNYEWYFDETLGGSYTFLGLSARLVGYYIEEAGTAPNPVSFSATFKEVGDPQEGNIDIPVGTTSKVVFPETGQADLDFTSGQAFNETNWVFTAPVKGKYAFFASAYTEHTGNNHGLTVSIHKNPTIASGLLTASEEGVTGATCDVVSAGQRRTAAASGILDLDKFDTVVMAAVTDSLGTETLDSVQFQGHLINSVGATTLEGKTYLPVDPDLREVANGTYSATTSQVENIDLSAEGITVPSNATHVIVRVQLDANGGSTAANDTHEAYAVPYAASPGPFDINDLVAYADNNSSENNTNTGSLVVPLNRPADPTADITVQINSTINTGAGAALNYNIWVDGFYIEESAVAVLQGTNALEGLTFVSDKRQIFSVPVNSLNKSGYIDISAPPAGAKYALVKFIAETDAEVGTSWTWIASAGPGNHATGTLDGAVENRVGSGQMDGYTNQWHDVQGSTLVDVTAGTVLGRFHYSVWVASGTIGAGTIGGTYVLEGWYIEDAGTEPSPFLGMRCIQQGLAHNTRALAQSLTTGGIPPYTFEYGLADFVSTDPSFDISKVWGVWVAYACDSDSADMRVRASWPDGVLQDIGGQDQVGVVDNRSSRGVTMIPINPGQPSVTLQLTFTGAVLGGADSASFQIIGLQQYVTGS